MKRDSRLSAVLHLLLHMKEAGAPMTSEQLAVAMQSNAVVVRRLMAGLRDEGLVTSVKGHGGGWSLAIDLSRVTLRQVHDALGSPRFFAMSNRTESPGCLIEQAVNAALDEAFEEAEAVLVRHLGNVLLSDLAADFHARMERRVSRHGSTDHA